MGKLSDKFLSMLRLNDDDYDDDEFYDDFDDETEEDIMPKHSVAKNKKYYEMEDDIAPAKETRQSANTYRSNVTPVRSTASASQPQSQPQTRSKVVPMRGKGRSVANNMEVCIIRPTNMNDCPDVTDTLLSGRAVILNLEGLGTDIAQRIIDFTSGSCYAINGNLQKITNYIFIITPESVDISGDFHDMIDGGLEMSSKSSSF